MILARLILEYEIGMPGGASERWPQFEMGRNSVPDPTKGLLLKKI